MYNVKFTLDNGTELFANYMNAEQRSILREYIGNKTKIMWCSCRSDMKLYYRISENLRFYPEHNGYEHTIHCARHRAKENKRITAFVRTDEETATIYLQFNPKNFTVPSILDDDDNNLNDDYSEDDDTNTNASDENEVLLLNKLKVNNEEYKEPKFNLINFIRCINHDTFTERVINNKAILSFDYFSSAIFGRLKNIKISGMNKSVRSLTLEDDGVRFFYAPYVKCEIKKSTTNVSHNLIIRGNDNTTYSLFTFGSIYEKALKRFHKQYGIDPNEHTMIAGFQYYPKSKSGSNYKVVGRFHMFQVSDHGLYCNSLLEQNCYNVIINYIKRNKHDKLRFYIPADDETVTGILEVEGAIKKGLFIFPSNKSSIQISIDKESFVPFPIMPDKILSEDDLTTFIDLLKSSK